VKLNEEDGSAKPAPIERNVKFKDSPITRTIEALLAGPTENEKRKGMTSFIPDDTELISAHIQNGHLTLNFNNTFEENYSGMEAIMLELSQVLLTSFNISQVTKLSILIESKSKRYITGEGIPLKEIYTKQDLSELMSVN
jgi:spore germination protein GerM